MHNLLSPLSRNGRNSSGGLDEPAKGMPLQVFAQDLAGGSSGERPGATGIFAGSSVNRPAAAGGKLWRERAEVDAVGTASINEAKHEIALVVPIDVASAHVGVFASVGGSAQRTALDAAGID